MSRILNILCCFALLSGSALAAGKGPEIQMIDGKVSMQIDSVPLGRLLHLLDQATGLTSKVPPEMSNQNLSVRFSGLDLDDAIRKIFEGQPIDYVFIGAQGIVVTGRSLSASGAPSAYPAQPQPPQQSFTPEPQPFVPDVLQQQPNSNLPQQQPAVINTPFGPIANPNARGNANVPASPSSPFPPPTGQIPPGGLFPSATTPFAQSPATSPKP